MERRSRRLHQAGDELRVVNAGQLADRAALLLLAAFFIVAGSMHFLRTPFYVRMVPPWLPAHLTLVQISGIGEVLGGAGVLFRRTRRVAGIGLVALLVAVFPANLEMALHPQRYADIGSSNALVARLPLQIVVIAWVWWLCLKSR